jgi:hypothetical protein
LGEGRPVKRAEQVRRNLWRRYAAMLAFLVFVFGAIPFKT